MGNHQTRLQKPPDKAFKRVKAPDGALLRWIDIVQSGTVGCLLWPYATDQCGYGCVRVGGKMTRAHRVICEKFHGSRPTSKHMAAHSCNNPMCCNPDHLRWATAKENQADRIDAGTHSRGTKHGNSRLAEIDVLEIKKLRGVYTQKELAERFGVSATHICQIQNGRKWAHV